MRSRSSDPSRPAIKSWCPRAIARRVPSQDATANRWTRKNPAMPSESAVRGVRDWICVGRRHLALDGDHEVEGPGRLRHLPLPWIPRLERNIGPGYAPRIVGRTSKHGQRRPLRSLAHLERGHEREHRRRELEHHRVVDLLVVELENRDRRVGHQHLEPQRSSRPRHHCLSRPLSTQYVSSPRWRNCSTTRSISSGVGGGVCSRR